VVTDRKAFLLGSAICASLAACVPTINKYWRVTAPRAAYLKSVCYGETGPRSITYYPYHGIFISIQLFNSPIPALLTLHIPTGSVVQLDGIEMRIHGLSNAGPYETTLSIRAAPHGGVGNAGPPEIYRTRQDPYTSPDNFGPLAGGDEQGTLLWYLYKTDGSIPPGTISGTLTLPSLTIDGHRYEPQSLSFAQDTFFGVTPVNC
jgi:hypothetical protein